MGTDVYAVKPRNLKKWLELDYPPEPKPTFKGIKLSGCMADLGYFRDTGYLNYIRKHFSPRVAGNPDLKGNWIKPSIVRGLAEAMEGYKRLPSVESGMEPSAPRELRKFFVAAARGGYGLYIYF